MTNRPLSALSLLLLVATTGMAGPIQFGPSMLEPSPFLLWDLSTTLRSSIGYKDNPTLASDAFRESSLFLNLNAEVLLFRLPTGGNSFHLFWSGEDRRYFDSPFVQKEQLFITQAAYSYDFGGGWSAGLTAQHMFINQVIDLSSEDLGLGIASAIGHTFTLRPTVRYDFAPRWWLEAEADATRQLYEEPLDDYKEYVPKLLLGFRLPHDSSVTLAYTHTWRPFDDSPLLTPSRELLPDTNTRIQADRWEIRWKQNWSAAKTWSTTLRGFEVFNRDNGLGFFDYHRVGGAASLQWAPKRWKFKLSAKASHYDYDQQLIAPDEAITRERDDLGLEAQAEWEWRKNFRLFVAYELDRSRGNMSLDNFTANTIHGGFEWEF